MRLRRLQGASSSFGPVEKETLPLPQPLVWQPFGAFKAFARSTGSFGRALPEPLVWQLQDPVWLVSKGLKPLERLRCLKGASGSFGPVEKETVPLQQPLVWQPLERLKGLQEAPPVSGVLCQRL